jgi:hypothetical protein
MQCAPVVARVFALRQGFAGFASGQFLKRYDEDRAGDAMNAIARHTISAAHAVDRSRVQLRLIVKE